MDTPGSAPEVTRDDVLGAFGTSAAAHQPLTAAEVGDELECPRGAAQERLDELVERGYLRSREIDGSTRIWWPARDSEAGESTDSNRSQAEQFSNFVDAVKDYAIFMLDPDGHVVNWNDGAERIKGYTAEEIVGEHFSTFYTEEDVRDGVPERNLERAAANGRVEDQGWRVHEDGSTFWADVVITAIRDEDGTLQGYTKVTRDLTERREYEQQLRRERDVTERILETVPVSISVVTRGGEFVRANSRTLERLGIDEDDLDQYAASSWTLYADDGEEIPPDETPWVEAAETGSPVYDYQCQVDLPDIGRRWLSINAAPIDLGGDAEGHVVLSVDDVTARREREQELRRERNQTEELLRTAPIAISVQDSTGETMLANQRAQEVPGLSEREVLEAADGRTLYEAGGEVIDPEGTPTARVRDTGEPVFEQEIGIEKSGEERRWFSVNATPVHGPDGDLERIITTADDITQLKRREHQLERQKSELESELSEVLGRVSDAFYAVDREWRFTHVNNQAEDLFQRSREELVGSSLWDTFSAATDTVIWSRFHEAMETQEPVSFEYQHHELDAWLEVNAYPSETGLSVYFQDITNRKSYEEELQRYRTIVETVNDGVYTVDADGRFTSVNEAYAEMTGYAREALIGEHVSLVVDEETIERARHREAEMLDGDVDTGALEAEILTADGESVPAEATFALLPSDDAEYERVGVVRDISERKARERALEESERRYRTLVENFPDGVVALFDESLRYTAAGGQLLDTLGIDAEEAVGTSIWERYPEEIVTEIEPHFEAALDGEARTFDIEYLGRHLSAHILPVRDADDEVYAGMLVVQDVTERTEYRRQLEELVEKLESSNERLEQFAYAASHDLQEPLRMVSSYLQLVKQRYKDELDEDGREFIEFAVDGADRMREMIEGLLEYSRIETQGDSFEPVELDDVLEDVLEDLQVRIEETSAEITAEDLPCVEGDASQLRQVFQNLLKNAIDYSGDEPPWVHVSAERDGDEWVISVSDDGVGIDPDDQERVFGVFKRLTTSDDHPGTGIGLALCERIVERHGGDIWVESEPGEGSTIQFTLPQDGRGDS